MNKVINLGNITSEDFINDPKRLGNLIYRKDVQYYSRDLTNDSWFFDEIDFCIYCAGYAQPNKFLSDAEKTYQLNALCPTMHPQ